jgi:hypothetical protein
MMDEENICAECSKRMLSRPAQNRHCRMSHAISRMIEKNKSNYLSAVSQMYYCVSLSKRNCERVRKAAIRKHDFNIDSICLTSLRVGKSPQEDVVTNLAFNCDIVRSLVDFHLWPVQLESFEP